MGRLGLQAVGLWFSGVCPLVSEAGPEAYGAFLEGRTSTCPLVGGAASRGTSIVNCGLRKSFGNLSADGWDFVPTQLVV